MDKVRVYYAGIPEKNTKAEKRDVLSFFHQGVPQGLSKEIETMEWAPSELAVMQGWVHERSGKAPHLTFRRTIIDKQKQIGKHTLAIDSNLFLYQDPKNTHHYLRFSLDGVFPTTGNYFTDRVDPKRWQQIKQDLNLDLKKWRSQGNHILICMQRNGGWSMSGLDVMNWLDDTVTQIKRFSDRPILVRAHPGDKQVKNYLKINYQGVRISKSPSLKDDLQNAWATVTYNSSPGVASAIEGIPVFVTDIDSKKSQAFNVANFNLSQIEKPVMPERQEWIEKISMCHFNFRDLKKGVAWNIIKDYL
jgi:hypothetical protein